jgi:hypothetical protein
MPQTIAIRARVAARRTLDRPRGRGQDRRLLQTAEARFPGGWPEAVAVAAKGRPHRRRAERVPARALPTPRT